MTMGLASRSEVKFRVTVRVRVRVGSQFDMQSMGPSIQDILKVMYVYISIKMYRIPVCSVINVSPHHKGLFTSL